MTRKQKQKNMPSNRLRNESNLLLRHMTDRCHVKKRSGPASQPHPPPPPPPRSRPRQRPRIKTARKYNKRSRIQEVVPPPNANAIQISRIISTSTAGRRRRRRMHAPPRRPNGKPPDTQQGHGIGLSTPLGFAPPRRLGLVRTLEHKHG